jgi:hypothetical protein
MSNGQVQADGIRLGLGPVRRRDGGDPVFILF